jgi:hypothetical protein
MLRSRQWLVCAGIFFGSAVALTVVGLWLSGGQFVGGLAGILFLLLGIQCLFFYRRMRKAELEPPSSANGGAPESSVPPGRGRP